jgi:hypothetical protein
VSTATQRSFLLIDGGIIEILGQFPTSGHAFNYQYYGVVLVSPDNAASGGPPVATTPTYNIETLFEPWNDTDKYPAACAVHEDRLVFGGTNFMPHTIWASDTGDFLTHSRTTNASDSIATTLAPRERSPIRWLESKDILICGTDRGEWVVGERGVALTPSNVFARQHSEHGCAIRKPVIIQDVVCFIERGQKRIRAFRFTEETNSYMAEDLTMLAEHLFTETTIEEIAYQRLPFPVLWAITADGTLCALSFMRDQGVAAWSKWKTGANGTTGAYDNSDTIESITVVKGDNYDDVYVSVKRTINGAVQRFVEYFHDIFTSGTITDVVALDCCVVDVGLTAAVSGLDHFEGDVVTYIVDGDKDKVGTATVSSGAITMTWTPTVKAVIGLPYTSKILTMRVDAGADGPLAIGLKKMFKQAFVRFYNTVGGSVGPDTDRAQPVPNADTIFTDDRQIDGIRGAPEVFEDSRLGVFQTQPVPMTVLAVQADNMVNEG